jgi:hypothetical protein
MIEQIVGTINDKPYIFCQCETVEEQKKYNLPLNVTSFWKHGSEVILAPGQIINKIQESIKENKFVPQELASKKNIESYYQKLINHQNQMVIEHAERQIEEINKLPNKEHFVPYIKEMEKLIENHKNQIYNFDIDGVTRADSNRAKKILGEQAYNQLFPEGSIWLDNKKI